MEVNLDHTFECVQAFASGNITVDELTEKLSADEKRLIMVSYRIVEEMSGGSFEEDDLEISELEDVEQTDDERVEFELTACNEGGELTKILVSGCSNQSDFHHDLMIEAARALLHCVNKKYFENQEEYFQTIGELKKEVESLIY